MPVDSSEILDGKRSTLGRWLAQIRGNETNPRWTRQPLNVQGMRYDMGAPVTGLTSEDQEDLADLADLVRAADNARLGGDEADLADSSQRIDNILGDIDSFERAIPLAEDREMLVAAFDRWARYGTLDPRPGDPAGQLLDQWLENIRLGLAAVPPPSGLRAILGALGLDWDACRPPGPPVPLAAAPVPPLRRVRARVSAPREAPSLAEERGEMIAGLLQAEHATWLALNRAARLQPYQDGWLWRERQAFADARAATDRALADGQPGDNKTEAKLLGNLRAAVGIWREAGHLEVPVKSARLDGKKSSVGSWLAQIRPAKSAQAKRGDEDRSALDAAAAEYDGHAVGARGYY